MAQIFTQTKYEKLADDLYLLGANTILRFNVNLAKLNPSDNTRMHFHKEYKYNSNKYTNERSLMTMRRSFDFFLSIENLKAIDNLPKEFIMIRVQDIILLRRTLSRIIDWTLDPKIFATDKGKPIIFNKPDTVVLGGLAMNKSLEFTTTIVRFPNDDEVHGIRMYVGNNGNYVDMTIDKFMGFVYIIESINMYESAQLMINYIQRPDYGTNLYEFEINKDEEDSFKEKTVSNVKSRTIGKTKSFFDKIDEL